MAILWVIGSFVDSFFVNTGDSVMLIVFFAVPIGSLVVLASGFEIYKRGMQKREDDLLFWMEYQEAKRKLQAEPEPEATKE